MQTPFASFDLSYNKRPLWEILVKKGHKALRKENKITRNDFFNELEVMRFYGIVNEETWYALTREERARKTAHYLANNAMEAILHDDAVEEAQKEAKRKRGKK